MKVKIKVNAKPLEDYLNMVIKEIESSHSEMTRDILKGDLSHRAIWIEPTNNVHKLVDLDMVMQDNGLEVWNLELTLNPVNIHEKNTEIRQKFQRAESTLVEG